MKQREQLAHIGADIPKDLKAKVQKIAREQRRSLSKQLAVILTEYISKKPEESQAL